LNLKALQEAIAAFRLEKGPKCFDNIMSNITTDQRALINRCIPFVKYVTTGTDDNGVFRLSHQSVHKFLLEVSKDKTEAYRMVDTGFLAKSCISYLFQERFDKPLVKYQAHQTMKFSSHGGSDIGNHHFLQYAAKYWYRHLDETKYTEDLWKYLVGFMKSSQFITALQVQSLFVPGHFIQDLDCDDRSKRCVKKNLPDWLKSHGEEKIVNDYHDFIAEWGCFLQRGTGEIVNGELDRCLWSILGPSNYFSRYSSIQRYTACLLQPGEDSTDKFLVHYIAAASYDEMRVTIWKVSTRR
jgi:hypothetical protein